MVYEWDAKKAKGNRRKHRISFEDAASVFLDPLALTFPDPDHGGGTRNHHRSFQQAAGCVCVALPTRDRVRIISARKTTRGERKQYEEGIGEGN